MPIPIDIVLNIALSLGAVAFTTKLADSLKSYIIKKRKKDRDIKIYRSGGEINISISGDVNISEVEARVRTALKDESSNKAIDNDEK